MQKIDRITSVVTDKSKRSVVFIVIALLLILFMNAALPMMEGQTKYTAEPVSMTYKEYKEKVRVNKNFKLTYKSEKSVEDYIAKYLKEFPDTPVESISNIEPPDTFRVNVYTKFFFQYSFWYISTLLSLVSSVLFFYSMFNYLITRAKLTNKKYNELMDILDTLNNELLDSDSFEPWIDSFNRERKIKQHKANIKYKLDKLERRTPYYIKKKFKQYFEAMQPNNPYEVSTIVIGPDLTEREKKYINKREMYMSLLDETYIEQYVVNGNVKYFKYIHPMFVYSGTNNIGRVSDSYSNIKSDAARLASDGSSKVTLSLSMTVIFAIMFTMTAVSSTEQSVFWIIINILSKIVPLFTQLPMSIDYTNKFMETHLIPNLIARRSIAYMYGGYVRRLEEDAKKDKDRNRSTDIK